MAVEILQQWGDIADVMAYIDTQSASAELFFVSWVRKAPSAIDSDGKGIFIIWNLGLDPDGSNYDFAECNVGTTWELVTGVADTTRAAVKAYLSAYPQRLMTNQISAATWDQVIPSFNF